MAYCNNCGEQITDNTKFCPECGSQTTSAPSSPSERQQEYSGKIIKCPSCGEMLKSFEAICPACGYELRESKVPSSIRDFSLTLNQTNSEKHKIELVRSFPIPNAKEDIFEFMILASTNIAGEVQKAIFDAWLVKIEQCYQKAKLVFRNDADFSKIQDIYDQAQKKRKKETFSRNIKTAGSSISKSGSVLKDLFLLLLENLPVWLGIIAFIWAIQIDISGGNASMHEIIGVILLIVSAAILKRRNATYAEFLMTGLSGALSIYLSQFLGNGSMLQLGGGVVLIIVVVNFFRKLSNKEDKRKSEKGIYILTTIVFLVTFTIIAAVNGGIPSTGSLPGVKTFEWPDTELSRLIPQPESNKGEISSIDAESLNAEVAGLSISKFEAYINKCKENGFTVDSKRNGNAFTAYNDNHFYLRLQYTDYDSKMTVYLEAPKVVGELQWPNATLTNIIPDPKSANGEITLNDETTLWVLVYDFSESKYEAYLNEIQNYGFTIDSKMNTITYNAYNETGYHITIHDQSNEYDWSELFIVLKAPMEMKSIRWPETKLVKQIPVPKTDFGKIDSNRGSYFTVYIGNTTPEVYADYVDACVKKGFTEGLYNRSETSFHADNSSGSTINVDYIGFNTMKINIYNFDY